MTKVHSLVMAALLAVNIMAAPMAQAGEPIETGGQEATAGCLGCIFFDPAFDFAWLNKVRIFFGLPEMENTDPRTIQPRCLACMSSGAGALPPR